MTSTQPRRDTTEAMALTRHPLFPATVALWFGALFGLGSLAIRPALLDTAVAALGVAALIPAAAPPLGITARILLALAMAALGGTLGAMLGRWIARPAQRPRERVRKAGLPADAQRQTKAASLLERLGVGGEPEAPLPRRRGQLALSEDTARTDYEDRVPVPGASPRSGAQIFDVGAFDLDGFETRPDETAPAAFEADCPADTDDAAHDDRFGSAIPEGAQVFQPIAPDAKRDEPATGQAAESKAPEPERPMAQEEAAEETPVPLSASSPENKLPFTLRGTAHAEIDTRRETVSAPGFSLIPRFAANPHQPVQEDDATVFNEPPAAPLFSRPQASPGDAERETGASASPAEEIQPADAAASATGPAQTPATAADRIAKALPDELSNAELLERLALTLQRKRAERAEAAARQPAAPLSAEPASAPASGWTPAETAGEPGFVAPPFAAAASIAMEEPAQAPEPAPAIPAAFRPFPADEDTASDDCLPGFVPPRQIGSGAALAHGTKDNNEEDAALLADGYSSLLDLSRGSSAASSFVRIEEPEDFASEPEPVVIFPGQTGPVTTSPVTSVLAQGPFARPAAPPPSEPEHPAPIDPAPVAEEARRFDPPAPQTAATPVVQTPRADPAETERALKAALASLQRMSGAA